MKNSIIKHDIKKAPKTGDWRYMKPEVDKEKCLGCGTCASFCPEAAIELVTQNLKPKTYANIDYYFCKGCGVCADICPLKAIRMKNN